MTGQSTEKDAKRCSCGSLVVERQLAPNVRLRSHVERRQTGIHPEGEHEWAKTVGGPVPPGIPPLLCVTCGALGSLAGASDLDSVDHAAEHYATTGSAECWCVTAEEPPMPENKNDVSLAALAERIAYELAETVDGEWGCCHSTDDLRAGGRLPDFAYEEFEPLPETCQGRRVLDEWLPQIAALVIPPGCNHCGQALPHAGSSWRESGACRRSEHAIPPGSGD